MRVVFNLMNVVFWIVILVAAINVAYAFVGGYMIATGRAVPGEPIYLDELAPELGYAIVQGFIAFGVICLAIGGLWWVRRGQYAS